MKKIILLVLILQFVLSASSSNNRVLFSIDDKNYTADDFPKDFRLLDKRDKKKFLGNYLYYDLLLNELKSEQKKYNKSIEKALEKNSAKLQKIGVDKNSSYALISYYKTMFDTVMRDKFAEKYKDIDKRVKKFYEKHKKEYLYPNRFEVSHIVVKDKNKTEKIIKNLIDKNASIKDFAILSQKENLDRNSKYAGGYIGYISEKTTGKKFFKEMWDSNISYGVYPKPFKQKDYFHIFYIINKKKSEQISLDEDRENIISYIIREDKRKWIDKNVKDIKKRRKIRFY